LTLFLAQVVVDKVVPGLRDYYREQYVTVVKPALKGIDRVTITS